MVWSPELLTQRSHDLSTTDTGSQILLPFCWQLIFKSTERAFILPYSTFKNSPKNFFEAYMKTIHKSQLQWGMLFYHMRTPLVMLPVGAGENLECVYTANNHGITVASLSVLTWRPPTLHCKQYFAKFLGVTPFFCTFRKSWRAQRICFNENRASQEHWNYIIRRSWHL